MIDIHIATISAIYRYAAQEGDRLVARANPTARAAYRREVERILRAEDVQRSVRHLGKAMTDELGNEVLTCYCRCSPAATGSSPASRSTF